MITPTFTVWKFKGIQFLAVERGADVHVVDDQGGNYGSWHTAKAFRKRQKKGEEIAKALTPTSEPNRLLPSQHAYLSVRLM